jgi:plasmid stabilization system protein ParE
MYMVFYRGLDHAVEIVRVLHASRDRGVIVERENR